MVEQWNYDKTKYAADKKRIEEEIRSLQEKKEAITGFGADLKRKKLDDAILKLTIELKNLVIPEKPVNIDEPVLPRKPALRRMPVLTFEEKVGKKEVREVFFSEWNK